MDTTRMAIESKNIPLIQHCLKAEQETLAEASKYTGERLAAYWYGYGCNEQECKARIVALTDALLNN